MAEYPINIVLNVSGQGKLQQISQTLQYMRQEGSQAGKALTEISNALNAMGKGKFGSLSTALKDIQSNSGSASKDLQTLAKSVNEIKGNNLKTISTELQKISKASSQMAGQMDKLNFKGLNGSIGTLKSIDTTLKQLLSTVESLKANSNIKLNVTTNASAARSELQALSNGRLHTYKTGSRNGINYYGWGGDYDMMYQKATPFLNASRGVQRMGEKVGLVGANLMMAGSFLGARELTDTIIETPAKAETQKYLLSNMQRGATITQEGGGGATSLYKTLDKTTDQLPISMQNVVQPLYAFQAATGASAQELNNIIPEFANFGAQVINMTGSEDLAETAMEKLARAYMGQYQGVDQYGISEESLKRVGYEEGGTVEEFMAAVQKISGDAKQSMNNFNGLKALVGKDFSRAGKQLWNNGVGQAMNGLVGGFHGIDQAFGGFTTQLIVAGAGILDLSTTITTVVGSLGTTIGTFGQIFGNIQAIRKNGGGLLKSAKNIFSGVNEAGIYGASAVGGMYDEFIDTAGMETAVYEGALAGTMQGVSGGTLGQMGKKNDYLLTSDGKSYRNNKELDLDYLENATVKKYPKSAYDDLITYRAIDGMSGEKVIKKHKDKQAYKNRVFGEDSSADDNYNLRRNGARFFQEMDAIERDYLDRSRPARARIRADLDRRNAPGLKDKTKATISNKLNRFEKQKLALMNAGNKVRKAGNKVMNGANKAGSAITKGFKQMISPLSFLASPKLLLGVGAAAMVAQAGLSYAAAHSQKVADSYRNLQNATGSLGESISKSIGNWFNNMGWSTEKGTNAVYDVLSGKLDDLSHAIRLLAGDDETPKSVQDETGMTYTQMQEYDAQVLKPGEASKYDKNRYGVTSIKQEDGSFKMSEFDTMRRNGQIDADKWYAFDNAFWGFIDNLTGWDFNKGSRNKHDFTNDYYKNLKEGDTPLSREQLANLQNYAFAHSDLSYDKLMEMQRNGYMDYIYGTDGDIKPRVGNGDKSDAYVSYEQFMENKGKGLPPTAGTGYYQQFLENNTQKTNLPNEAKPFDWGGLLKSLGLSGFGGTDNKGTQSNPIAVTNADSKNDDGKAVWNDFLDLIGVPKALSAANVDGEQAALQNAVNNPNPNQIPSSAIAGNQQQITPEINTQDGMQKGTDYATQFTQGFQQSLTTTPININNLFGGQNMDLTTKGNEWAGQLVSGFNSGFSSDNLNIGDIGSKISSHNGEVNSAGQGLGKSGTDGFNAGFGDLSGIAGNEAGEIASALRSHIDEVRQAANELAQAAMTGFNKDPNSIQNNSPGRLAKKMYAEGDEIVKSVYDHVNPLRYATNTLASSAVRSFDYASTGVNATLTSGGIAGLNYSSSLSSNNTSDKSASNDNRNVVINNNFHIDKIDSKERVKEIAETLVHIMTFNNETAGRNTSVGL